MIADDTLTFVGTVAAEGRDWLEPVEKLDRIVEVPEPGALARGREHEFPHAYLIGLPTPVAVEIWIDTVCHSHSPIPAEHLCGPEPLRLDHLPVLRSSSRVRLHVRNPTSRRQAVSIQLRRRPPYWRGA